MIEYRITANDPEDEDRVIRAVHADDLCSSIWGLQQLLREAASGDGDGMECYWAGMWLARLQKILDETGAQAAMDHYR